MGRLIIGIAATLALTACNGQSTIDSAEDTGEVSLKNASVAEVVRQAAAAGTGNTQMKPGKWETVAEVSVVDLPGLPAGAERDQVLASMKQAPVRTTQCLKAEQLKKPDPSMFTGKGSENCTYKNFQMANGKIDATLVCNTGAAGTMTNVVTGSFGADSYVVDSDMKTEGGEQSGQMHMKMHMTAKRIGDCDA